MRWTIMMNQKLHFDRGSELVDYFKRPDHKSPLWALTKCALQDSSSKKHYRKFVSSFVRIVRGK
jgi:hypothetical protein